MPFATNSAHILYQDLYNHTIRIIGLSNTNRTVQITVLLTVRMYRLRENVGDCPGKFCTVYRQVPLPSKTACIGEV